MVSRLFDTAAPFVGLAWERQPDETPRAFAAFATYRDTAPAVRSLPHCCKAHHGDQYTAGRLRQWERWSTAHQWVERAAAWDEHRDQVKRAADLDAIEEMQRRHCEVASVLLDVVRESVERFRAAMERDPDLRLPLQQIASVLNTAATLERVARGEPETITRQIEENAETVVKVVWGDHPELDDEDTDESLAEIMGEHGCSGSGCHRAGVASIAEKAGNA